MSHQRRVWGAVLCAAALCCLAAAAYADRARGGRLDPVGVWNCMIFGHPRLEDERVFLRIRSDETVDVARVPEARTGRWVPLSGWRESRDRIEFEDARTARQFQGDLTLSTLGGTWRAAFVMGSWWCAPAGGIDAGDDEAVPPPASALMPLLVPAIMASPSYPREAIREAKEGRAVSCFFVNADGEISNPELLELSDEIFREPTLAAVSQSRYRASGDEDARRPACRTFIFELDAVY